MKVFVESGESPKPHRSYRSIFAGPGCGVTSHRQCAALPHGDVRELDPSVSEPVDAREHVHVAGEGASLHADRKHELSFVAGSF